MPLPPSVIPLPLSYSTCPHVPNYLVHAIVVTVLCCLPAGIAAIVYAAQVNSKLNAGDYGGALACSRKAKKWCWISALSTGVMVLFSVLIGFLEDSL